MDFATPQVMPDGTVAQYIPGQPIPALIRDPRTGEVQTNVLKKFVKPFELALDPGAVTLDGGAQSLPIPMTIDAQGHFEVFEACYTSQRSEGFTVQIFDPEREIALMNREVHVETIASGAGTVLPLTGILPATSSAGRPFKWPETFWMNAKKGGRRAIFIVLRNLSPSSNTVRFVLRGMRWYYVQAPAKIAEVMQAIYRSRFRTFPYFHTTEQFVRLAALAKGEFEIRFGDDSWTEWIKTMMKKSGPFDVRIWETTSQKRLIERTIPSTLVFGNAEFPFLNWESALLEPNLKLTFELTDTSNAENVIWVTLGCRRIQPDPKEVALARPA